MLADGDTAGGPRRGRRPAFEMVQQCRCGRGKISEARIMAAEETLNIRHVEAQAVAFSRPGFHDAEAAIANDVKHGPV